MNVDNTTLFKHKCQTTQVLIKWNEQIRKKSLIDILIYQHRDSKTNQLITTVSKLTSTGVVICWFLHYIDHKYLQKIGIITLSERG